MFSAFDKSNDTSFKRLIMGLQLKMYQSLSNNKLLRLPLVQMPGPMDHALVEAIMDNLLL